MPRVALTVRHVRHATPRSLILTVDLGGSRFAFAPGQAVVIGVPGHSTRKPYSIACAPEDAAGEGALEFLVRVDPASPSASPLARVRRGSVVEIDGPLGSFRFPRRVAERQVLFVAGGTGIAPIRSMLRHALAAGYDGRLTLVYSARSDREFAYLPEFRRLAHAGRLHLALTASRDASPGWREHRGRIDLARLQTLVADPATLCFVCGPTPLVTTVPPLLRRLGIASRRIRTEEW